MLLCGPCQQKCKELKRELAPARQICKNSRWWRLLKRPGASRQVLTRQHLSQPSDRRKSNSGKRIKERDVGGESGAAPSQQLLSPGLSVPSLSHLTSLLKPLAVTKNKPTSTPPFPPSPTPPMLRATFHPRPCPKLPLSFHPPPFDAYTQTRGSDCLRGHAPNIRAREEEKKEQWERAKAGTLSLAHDFH